jgi:hypothetical protein
MQGKSFTRSCGHSSLPSRGSRLDAITARLDQLEGALRAGPDAKPPRLRVASNLIGWISCAGLAGLSGAMAGGVCVGHATGFLQAGKDAADHTRCRPLGMIGGAGCRSGPGGHLGIDSSTLTLHWIWNCRR